LRNPAELARKCFALAKSPGTEAEGEAALARGMAILERHGLNADDFDIPGRAKSTPRRAAGTGAEFVMFDDVGFDGFNSHASAFADMIAAIRAAADRERYEAMADAALRGRFAEDIRQRSAQQTWASRVDAYTIFGAKKIFNDQGGS
jgi:hypothetical protein